MHEGHKWGEPGLPCSLEQLDAGLWLFLNRAGHLWGLGGPAPVSGEGGTESRLHSDLALGGRLVPGSQWCRTCSNHCLSSSLQKEHLCLEAAMMLFWLMMICCDALPASSLSSSEPEESRRVVRKFVYAGWWWGHGSPRDLASRAEEGCSECPLG